MASRGLTLVSSTPTPTPNPGLPTRLSANASKINAAASFIIWPNTLQATIDNMQILELITPVSLQLTKAGGPTQCRKEGGIS